jgi:hypothetical protein
MFTRAAWLGGAVGGHPERTLVVGAPHGVASTNKGVLGMSTVFDLLERDWSRLATSRLAARQLRPALRVAGGARSLAELEAYVRTASPEEADRVLVALVAPAVEGVEVAARVLLQLLLPGTRNLARRWWALGDDDERAAAAVAAVYRRIRNYPLARRPGRIAANVLMDAAHELRAAVPAANVELWADPTIHQPRQVEPLPDAAAELASVLADAVRECVITPDDARLIAQTRIAGRRVQDLAHTTARPRTLWDRRQRAEHALAARGGALVG